MSVSFFVWYRQLRQGAEDLDDSWFRAMHEGIGMSDEVDGKW